MKKEMPKTEEEWKSKLTSEQYKVLRQKGTEMPFTGKLLDEKRKGAFACAACGQVLFDSKVKFDSGTGWPSFYDAKPGAVNFREDTSQGMHRTEVTCSNCGSHLGHVFEDVPKNKGKRYCINSCSLNFKER